MQGCPKSGSLFTPLANDVVDASRQVNRTFFFSEDVSFFFTKKHDFLNISQKTQKKVAFFFDIQCMIL